MDLVELAAELRKRAISPFYYNLSSRPVEGFCVEHEHGLWFVRSIQAGLVASESVVDSKAAACSLLLEKVSALPAFDRHALDRLLRARGLSEWNVNLWQRPSEGYWIETDGQSWFVRYSERGTLSSESQFSTEDEACRELFEVLKSQRRA